MSPEVVFAPEAEEQLVGLYRYIAVAGLPEAADRYTDSIVAFCEELVLFPHRGKPVTTLGQVCGRSAFVAE